MMTTTNIVTYSMVEFVACALFYELYRVVCFITRPTLWLLANVTQGKSNHKI